MQISVNLTVLLQIALIGLIAVAAVAIIQLVMILFDVHQVTKRIRKAVTSVDLLENFFDAEDMKAMIKKCRKAFFGFIAFIIDSMRKLLGGGEKNG